MGGDSNTASGNPAFIGGGFNNSATAPYASIMGGGNNTASCNNGFIGAGFLNNVTAFSTMIGSGCQSTASGCYSSVVGGALNTASGIYSAVLGGKSNIASCAYSGIYGCNITSVLACAFHANRYVATNLPDSSAGLPSGTLWYDPTDGNRVKYIP